MSATETDFRKTRPKYKCWTPEEDAKLISSLEAGLSYAQAGRVIGRTKDSCLGRVASLTKDGIYTRPDRADLFGGNKNKVAGEDSQKKRAKRSGYKKGVNDRNPVKARKMSAISGIETVDDKKVLPPTIRDLPNEETPTMKTIAEVGFCECRWPVQGRGAAMLCCGAKTDDRVYCDTHSAIAYREKINAK